MTSTRTIIAATGALVALAAATWAGAATPAGDAAKGKAVFTVCSGCHVLTGPSFAGPPLAGVVGRKAGTAKGFDYSKPLTASGIVWDDKSLDAFLSDPSKAVPGTAMFANLPHAQDRADVIAYLKTVPAPAP